MLKVLVGEKQVTVISSISLLIEAYPSNHSGFAVFPDTLRH